MINAVSELTKEYWIKGIVNILAIVICATIRRGAMITRVKFENDIFGSPAIYLY